LIIQGHGALHFANYFNQIFLLSVSLLKQKKNKIKLIYLLIIFKPFCIAFCNGELVSYGENSK